MKKVVLLLSLLILFVALSKFYSSDKIDDVFKYAATVFQFEQGVACCDFGGCESFGRSFPNDRTRDACNADHEYLKPQTISSYTYDLVVKGGATRKADVQIGLSVNCDFQVESDTNCYHTLKISKCDLYDLDLLSGDKQYKHKKYHHDSDVFSSLMKKNPLSFSLVNGSVEGVISKEDEMLAVLNLKRGIISSLIARKPTSENDESAEMRTDVQGTCPVIYKTIGPNLLHMTKNINECHFPSKLDWHYSPFSVFWNMSFVQMFLISSKAECLYTFNQDGLGSTVCDETHAVNMDSEDGKLIAVQTEIKQVLTLSKVSKQMVDSITTSTAMKSIEYEYERTFIPTTTLPYLNLIVKESISLLVNNSKGPIEAEVINYFITLVDALRSASDLKEIEKDIIACTTIPLIDCTSDDKERAMNFFIDALVQCNSLPCIRSFRRLVEMRQYVSENYLSSVLFSWNYVKITDPDFFQEIVTICSLKETQLCPFILSSAIHTFWMRDKELYETKPLPTGITNSLQYVFDLIGNKCDKQQTRVLTGLKALGNLGNVSQKYKPAIEATLHNCVINTKLSWPVRLEAIDATRRFTITTTLYERLLVYMCNEELSVDMRILAYKILADSTANDRFMNDLVTFLESDTPYQLKSFIKFHLKSVLTRRDAQSAKFAKIIRRAELDRILDLEQLPDPDEVSSQTEKASFFKMTYLPDTMNQFGRRFTTSKLFDGQVFQPFSEIRDFTVKLFGKDVNLFQFLLNTRDTSTSMAYVAEYFSKHIETLGSFDAVSSVFTSEFNQNVTEFLSKIDSPLKYAYNVDNTILKNLNRIRQHFDFDGSKVLSFLAAFRMFGDDLGFVTTHIMNSALFRFHMLVPNLINKPHHTSGVTRILEAFHLVPTVGGIPLNWTSDAALVHSLDFAFNFNVSALGGFIANIPLEFSGAGLLLNKMLISLPGFTQGGIKMSHTISTSFDTTVKIRMQATEQNVAITPPKKQMRILRISRYGTIFSKQGEIEIEDSSLGKAETSRCLDDLVPYTGVLLCRKKLHAKVEAESNKLWALVGSRAVWELTADFPDKNLEKYTMLYKNGNNPGGKNVSILFMGKGQGRSREMFFSHVDNATTNAYETQFLIPEADFKAKLSRNPNRFNGFTTHAEALVQSRNGYSFEYSTGEREVFLVDAALPHDSTVGKKSVLVNVHENILNVTTPSSSISWNRTHMMYPHSKVIDHVFSYHTSEVYPLHESILPEVVYENPQVAWLRLQHHQHFNESNFGVHRSYSYLKTPNTILEIQMLNHPMPRSRDHTLYFNVTQRSLPGYKLKTFLNLSYFCKNEVDGKLSMKGHFANLTVPRLSWALESVQHKSGDDFNYTLLLKRERMTAKNDKDSELPVWWEPKTVRRFTSDSIDYKTHFHIRNNTSEMQLRTENPWIDSAARLFYSLTLPGWKTITLEGQALKEIRERLRMYWCNFNFTNPNLNFQVESWNNYTKELDEPRKESFKHNSVLFVLPNKKKFATYTIDGSMASKKLKFTELFESNFFVYQSNLFWNLSAPHWSDLKLNIVATSPVWKFLWLDLNQVVFYGGETMNMKHSLVDIDVVADWKNGYKKMFTFKSKDTNIIPNMVWKVEYPHLSPLSGLLKFSFPDSGLSIYALARISSDFKEIGFTFCKQALCDDLESEPDTFISQYVYTLDDPTHLAKTVIKNPPLIKEIQKLWNKRLDKISEAVMTAVSDPDHPVNKIARPFLKMTIDSWFYSKVASLYVFLDNALQYVIEIISTLEPIYNPFLDLGVRLYLKASYSIYTTFADLDDMWHLIAWPFSNARSWVAKLPLTAWDTVDAPGPVAGRSYVKIYVLPVHLRDFNYPRNRLRFNTAYYSKILGLIVDSEELNGKSPSQSPFYNPIYTRSALLYGYGRVRTFDGNMFSLVNSDPSSKCSHLLIHNRVNGKITVIHEGTHLNFMFPQFKISFHSYGGKIFVNDSSEITDVPIRSSDGFVNITRTENVIEMNTFYHLNVKCVINDLCIFSTTKFTHNHFVGLFGNNNRDPNDDVKVDYSGDGGPHSLFRLSSPSSCSDKEFDKHSVNDSSCYRAFYGGSTSDCQNVVPYEDFLRRCLEDEGRSISICDSINSYATLCAAHGVIIQRFLECSGCKDDFKMGQNDVRDEVEVIFLIDQWQQKTSTSFNEDLHLFAKSIEKSFKSDGYANVRFGLVGFGSLSSLSYWSQHSLNGKLMSKVDEFLHFGIKSLKYVEDNGAASDPVITFNALQTAIEHYSFSSRAVRLFILVTAQDPDTRVDARTMKGLQDAVEGMKSLGASLYIFSNYPSLTTNKMHSFRSSSGHDLKTDDFDGLYSKLAMKTKGSLFSSSALSDSRGESYFKRFTDEMVTRSKLNMGLCRYCLCHLSNYYLPRIKCREIEC